MELKELLKQVSRSFYLTMVVLPRSVRGQISIAYLLARATDTIADTELINVDSRIQTLFKLRNIILEEKSSEFSFPEEIDWKSLLSCQKNSSEKILLENISLIIAECRKFSLEDQKDIYNVLNIIISGQLLDLEYFLLQKGKEEVRSFQKEEQLDDYTYKVAGCVGEFWTRICRRYLYKKTTFPENIFLEKAIHFGKGLQLVNILRDLPADLSNGRCYLPEEELKKLGLKPQDLMDPKSYPKLKHFYYLHLKLALNYLKDGIDYLFMTPGGWRTWMMRLGLTWPILIGIETLYLLSQTNPLDPKQRVKVARKDLKKILLLTFFTSFIPGGWKRLFNRSLKKTLVAVSKTGEECSLNLV